MAFAKMTRRATLLGAAAAMSAPAVLRAQALTDQSGDEAPEVVRRNASSFVTQRWQDYFDELGKGCILCDISSRALHYWGPDDATYRLFPSSVPLSEELTKRGYTEVVRKKVGPTWTPTANMRKRDPSLPAFMPAGPGNPLGSHAMYLTWPAYLIHGTHDTRKIGRRSSSGCIGLYNEHVEDLFAQVQIGTQVLLL